MKQIVLSHLGLGDAIVSAGLAVHLARRYNGIRFVCWAHNFTSVSSFFVNHPEVEILPIFRGDEGLMLQAADIKLGHYSGIPAKDDEGFDEWIYRTAGVPISERWDSDPIPRAAELVTQHNPQWYIADADCNSDPNRPYSFVHDYSFIHEDASRNFIIKLEEIRKPMLHPYNYHNSDGLNSILAWAYCLRTAEQVHVINSSFYHLAETLPTTGSLHLHAYARPYGRVDFVRTKKEWEILK